MKAETTILFVDDENAYQKAFIRAMRKEKHLHIVTASRGIEALQMLQTTPVDVVLTDIKIRLEILTRYHGPAMFGSWEMSSSMR